MVRAAGKNLGVCAGSCAAFAHCKTGTTGQTRRTKFGNAAQQRDDDVKTTRTETRLIALPN